MKNTYLLPLLAGFFLFSFCLSVNAQTTVYNYTGGVQTYTVPAGVSAINVDVWGAQGGGTRCVYTNYQGQGGCGGRVQATLAVTPGQVLSIIVGGKGVATGAGGYNGGGTDHAWSTTWPGAGGGGASTIRDTATHADLVAAGGGGGGGGDFCPAAGVGTMAGDDGGAGGGLTGTNGNSNDCGAGAGGYGGTAIAGGAARACGGDAGVAGAFGVGGSYPAGRTYGAGGGGGGWYGGGVVGFSGGGGGGSSYTNPTYATAVTHTQGYNGVGCTGSVGNGQVTITVACNAGTITGTLSSCAGAPASVLTNTVTGGVWSSSVTGVATIASLTATTASVTAVGPGTTTIIYAVGGCSATAVYTVNPNPATITGTASVCIGSVTTLGETSGTTTWSSGTPTVATISATGVVTGVGAGTDIITFTLPTGCFTTTAVTVNSLPVAISGPTSVCVRDSIALIETTTGGTWSSGSIGVATVNPSDGEVTGISGGTAHITYTSSGGCTAFYTVTVNPTPAAIVTPSTVCSGTSVAATDVTAGGTWSTTSTTITVSSTGSVTGISSGVGIITYTSAAGCDTTANITVNSSPAPITGPDSVCVRSSMTLTEDSTVGTWSSSASGTGSVSTTGVVTGVAGGGVTISYTMPGGCYATYSVTVDALPAAIVVPSTVCSGTIVIATDATTGGTWSTTSTTITVSGAGTVTGVSSGTGIITYSTISGCDTTASITVNSSPAPITGPDSVCVRSSIILTEDSTTGTWSSSASGTASVSTTGVVTGIAGGITTISYTMPGGCYATYSVTVDALPAAIVVPSTVCSGTWVVATDATGGTWSTTSTTITITGAGTVTGVAVGTGIITYTTISGCDTTAGITVNPSPDAIAGIDSVCVGSVVILTDDSLGGTWSVASGIATVSPVGSATTTVGGVSGGTTTISYTMPGGCYSIQSFTVNALPAGIAGPTSVCLLSTITLTDGTGGGTWTASNGDGTIDPTSGVVTGVTAGLDTMTYTLITGCLVTYTVAVDPLPTAISGPDSVCAGGGLDTLTDGTPGGTWTVSGITGTATIGASSGIINGGSAGTVDVTYTIGTGCAVEYTVTVNALPAAIVSSSASGVCAGGYTIALTDATTPGTWGETDGTGTATITAGGILTGGNAGTVTVSYTNISGCYVTDVITVNPLPNAITGADTVCVGATDALTETTGGVTWSSTTGTIATVGAGTGIVTGVAAGTDSIICIVTATGCEAVYTITVNPLPAAITTPPSSVCAGGYTVAITDATTGGTWSETDGTGTATVSATSGIVTGGVAGGVTITYQLTLTGCYVTEPFTINPLPSAVVGPDTVCVGGTATLTDPSGGTWTITNGDATIVGATGVVTGVTAGLDTVIVTLATGCFLDFPITVNPNPSVPFGPDTVCVDQTAVLTDTTLGGTWSVTAGTGTASIVATSATTGAITGETAGTTTVSYTLITGCASTMTFTVNPIPNAIGGPSAVCLGYTITATETTGGGTWSLSNGTVASVDASGNVSGLTAGSDTLYYTLPTGCLIYEVITVEALPVAITGPDSVCVNSQILVTDGTGGGTWTVFNGDGTIVGAGATAVITGATAGIDTVYYTIGSGCYVSMSFTVNPLPNAIAGPTNVCVGSTITVTDATGTGTWSISPTSIATIDPTTGVITGVAQGTAYVTYTLPTSCYVTEAITVNPLPSSIAGVFTVCAGSSTTLFDATSGTWSIAPPTIATIGATTGIVNGLAAGIATVTFTTAAGCSVSQTFTVDPQPGAIITPLGDTVLCTGGYVELTANTGTGYTYQWTDGGPLTGATASSWLATTAGLYGVTVTNTFGCTTSTVINVSVLPVTATITAVGSLTFCGNVGVFLWADSSATGVTYQWMKGSTGITGATNATYTATVSGSFWLSESNAAGCSIASNTITTTELTTPAGAITAGGTTSFCIGETVALTSDSAASTWQWSLNGTPIIGATGISYTADSPGVYTVDDTNATGCSAIGSITVTVNPLPADSITASGIAVFCEGGSVTLSAPPGAGYLYQWYVGGIPITGATSINYSDTTGGLFTVLVTTGSGCSAITPVGFTVTEISSLTVTPLTPTSFCWGSSADLSVTVPGVTGVSFQWYYTGTAIPGATANTYDASSPGLYNCVVSVGGGLCSTGTNTITLTEFPLPNPIISYSLGVVYTQSYFSTYQWFEGSVMLPGATLYWLRAPSDGDYTVKVTDSNGCQSVSDVYILSVPLSVAALNAAGRNIKVYPNPAHTVVYVESDQPLSAVVSTLEGKKIADVPDARQIDVSTYADGVYLLSLYDTDGTLVKVVRIVKDNY